MIGCSTAHPQLFSSAPLRSDTKARFLASDRCGWLCISYWGSQAPWAPVLLSPWRYWSAILCSHTSSIPPTSWCLRFQKPCKSDCRKAPYEWTHSAGSKHGNHRDRTSSCPSRNPSERPAMQGSKHSLQLSARFLSKWLKWVPHRRKLRGSALHFSWSLWQRTRSTWNL